MKIRNPQGIRAALALLTVAAILGLAAHAQVPGQVDFQGLLLDAAGDPVNGVVDLDFDLFDAPAGGTLLWTESHTDVSVVDGVYDVALGSLVPLTPAVLASGDVYLEITVEGETLSPRRRLLAVPYALRAAEADAVDGFSGDYFSQIIQNYDFDGEPPNTDPREGLGDTDGDGVANFLDPDNDDDGLLDSVEVANGSDINVVTPFIAGFSPPDAPAALPTTVTINGTGFVVGTTVQFGAENPTPTNLTSTSLDVAISQAPVGDSSVTVTRPNGESYSETYPRTASLAIGSFSPTELPASSPGTVTVTGAGFGPGLSVQFGAENPTPQNVTPTSFDVDISPVAPGDSTVVVSLPNGESDSDTYPRPPSLEITGFSPESGLIDIDTVTVFGDGFGPGLVVDTFGALTSLTPTNITQTSFDVVAGPQPSAGTVPVEISMPNGETASSSYEFRGHRIVLVSGTLNGNIGGLAGADAICAARAELSGYGGLSFLAWLADGSESPATRFVQSSIPYRNIFQTKVADDWNDLVDGSLDAPIAIASQPAWGNVAAVGGTASGPDCNGWTSSSQSDMGRGGDAGTTGSWTGTSDVDCDSLRVLLCFEQ